MWTLLFDGFEITFTDQSHSTIKIESGEKVKIVACEAKSDKKVAFLSINFLFLNFDFILLFCRVQKQPLMIKLKLSKKYLDIKKFYLNFVVIIFSPI